MSKNLFVGVDGKARKTKEFYVGVNGKAHRIIKAYIGDENGKARLFWDNESNITENSLEFVSDNSFTMSATKLWDGTLEYNNGNGWTAWNGSQISSSNIDGRQRIYFRGSNNTYIMGSNGSRANAWKITGSNVECNGNLWNILDYNTVKQDNIPTHASHCFYHMFDSCEALVKVPALGTKYPRPVSNDHTFQAPEYCYAYMFYGCSNILEPAELVSHKMRDYCYLAMYQNCVKLTRSADLGYSEVNRAKYCYSHMFYGCSSLEEVKNLGSRAGVFLFYRTFSHCNSIRTIPDVIQYQNGKGTYDTWSTYQEAFSYCLGLRRYPTITTNNTFSDLRKSYENHFHKMFLGCSLPIYDSSSSGRISYIIPEDKKAQAGTINSFWGEESNNNQIKLNTTYYIKDPDITPISIPTQYLTFSSVNPFSISNYNLTKKVFYSTDKTNWECWVGEYETAKINPTNGKYEIYFAGEGNTSLYDSSTTGYTTFKIYSDTKDVECNGNINTLLDHIKVENNQEIVYTQKTFAHLFYNCVELISAPTLPATTLASDSYESMFLDCSSLITAPALPATTLARGCYNSMFRNCSKLTTAPELPATTLPQNSISSMWGVYAYMFSGCSSLTKAPTTLPATTLTNGCYMNMFSNCSKLTTAPKLPATTLAVDCYREMFFGCFRLRKIPALPAHILPDYCYYGMFKECDIHLYSSGDETKNIIYLLPSEKNQWTNTQKESNSLTDMFTYDGLIQTPNFPAGYRLDNYYSIIS